MRPESGALHSCVAGRLNAETTRAHLVRAGALGAAAAAIDELINRGTTSVAEFLVVKKYFTEAHKKIFKNAAGDLLVRLGYEKDNDW